MTNLVKAILIINAAKKGWTEEARRKAALTRKRKAKVATDKEVYEGFSPVQLKRQKQMKDALTKTVSELATKHGYKVEHHSEGVTVHSPHPKHPTSVTFRFLSPKDAADTHKDYRHEWPIAEGVRRDASGMPVLYASSNPETRSVKDIKGLKNSLPKYLDELRGIEYRHTGD